jgi:DNA phosphorothioation-dependent restriction protein DptF
MDLTLRDILSVLSKSSPFSVRTISERPRDEFDDAKEWLYVQQDIERDFLQTLSTLGSKNVVFLCGSSGDGKSEILARCQKLHQNTFRFHLDGTHSFAPHQSAIDALDQLFDESEIDDRSLVVGINIGMLANYAKEGAARHSSITNAIENFLNGEGVDPSCIFFDFEDYPKFHFNTNLNSAHSKFAKLLMQRLTSPSDKNPFYLLSKKCEGDRRDSLLLANYKLLALDVVQDAIITNLFKARLIKDQFITARALLDFIHHLLLGSGYLADNLFGGSDNELVQRMGDFDPARLHTQALDQFVLRYELELPNPELTLFIESLQNKGLICRLQDMPNEGAATLVRLSYLLRHFSIGNNFHHQFSIDFEETLLNDYAKVWMLHANYDGSNEAKIALRQFYSNELISAVYRYANRNAPWLQKGEISLGKSGSLQLAAPVDIKANFAELENKTIKIVSRFWAYLKVSDEALEPIAINLNLFELIFKLNRGYRPNKYDKNAVVLLDELIEKVCEVARKSNTLRFYENGHCYTAKQDDDMIEISGVV